MSTSNFSLKGKASLSIDEIAQQLNLSPNVVKKSLASAMRKLRDGRAEAWAELEREGEWMRGQRSGEHVVKQKKISLDFLS